MARGTMHAPKPDGSRRRRNAPAHAETVVERDEVVRGPEISDATGRSSWPEAVLSWWEDWRRAPQAALFERTDWRRLAMLAIAVEQYHRRGSAALLSEIRMNEERLGATVVDRMRARIRVDGAGETDGETAPVVALVPRSQREDV